MKCQHCKGKTIKSGKQKNGAQKYQCKVCKKYQQQEYRYQAYVITKRRLIVPVIINNCGFCAIAEMLGMCYNTVASVMFASAEKCEPPAMNASGSYEVDEMLAYQKKPTHDGENNKKQIWAACAINRKTKDVIGISVGRRTKKTLRRTINAVLNTNPKAIYTDKLSMYKNMIPQKLHKRLRKILTHIERLHRTSRNRLKMLNRGSLAFVRREISLLACLKLLFWWKPLAGLI